jgi:hypothetical protein
VGRSGCIKWRILLEYFTERPIGVTKNLSMHRARAKIYSHLEKAVGTGRLWQAKQICFISYESSLVVIIQGNMMTIAKITQDAVVIHGYGNFIPSGPPCHPSIMISGGRDDQATCLAWTAKQPVLALSLQGEPDR